MRKATLYLKKPNNLVQCRACCHYCLIAPGKTGICGVRQNTCGDLYLLVYGQPIAVNIDPIEKKPLYHFLPNTKIFSLGTMGCNFKCQFCQNWDISQALKHKHIKTLKQRRGENVLPEQIIDYCLSNKIPSIAYTYNEPAIFFEYAYDTAKLARAAGLKNVFVSNGYESKEALFKIKDYLDAINIDLKSFSDEFYQKICGARIGPVLENIKRAVDLNIHLEVTTLVIPGRNDQASELKQIAEFLISIDKNIPWHISRFYPNYKMPDISPTSLDKLAKTYNIGKKAGLNYVYVGNIISDDLENTYCPKCRETVIARKGYAVKVKLLLGACKKCGEKIKGVWS